MMSFDSLRGEQIAHPCVRRLPQTDGLECYEIRHGLNEEHIKYFEKGGVRLQWKAGIRKHLHGACNVSRGLAELNMWEAIAYNHVEPRLEIDDIGSNVSRTCATMRQVGVTGRMHVHHMMPHVLPGDTRRALAGRGRSTCTHKAHECDCPNDPDFAVSTHVLYYLTPDVVGSLLLKRYKQRLMYAVVHRMDQIAGRLVCGDLKYRMQLDGMISAEASNDNHNYSHPPNDWMFRSHVETSSGCLRIETLYHAFDSYVLRIRLMDTDVLFDVPRNPTFEHVLQENTYGQTIRMTAGATQEMRTILTQNILDLPSVDIHAYSTYIAVRTQTKNLAYVPKALVNRLAAEIVYTERTRSCLNTLVARCQQICNASGVPDELLEGIKLYAPVLAWVKNMAAETALLGRAVKTRVRLVRAHTEALALNGVAEEPMCWFANPFNWCNRDFETDEAQRFTNAQESKFVQYCIKTRIPCVVGKAVVLNDGPYTNPSELKSNEVPVLARGCAIQIGGAPRVPPNDGNQLLHAAGIVFTDHVPTLVAFTQENGVYAMAKRVLCDFQVPPSPTAWPSIIARRKDEMSILYCPMLGTDGVPLDYAHLVDWVQAYPENQRKQFFDAWDSLRTKQLNRLDFRMGGFIKLEKGLPVQCGGVTPRGIYSMSPRLAVCLSPVIKSVASCYREKYGIDSPILWTSGLTADDVGAYHDRCVAEFGEDCRILMTDQEKFEGHRSRESFEAYDALAAGWSKSRRFLAAVHGLRDVKVAYPRDDLSATIKDKMASGRGDISLCSFVDSVATVVYCQGEPATDGELKYTAMLNGDDGNLYGRFREGDAEEHRLRARDLGFEVTCELKLPWEIVFCRNRPWPSDRGTLFGPCVGWILARLGWHATDPRGWSPGAVARGLQPSCNHIPILRLFIKRMIEVTPDTEAAPAQEWALRATAPANPVPESYVMLYNLYGLTEADEEDFAHLMATVEKAGTAIHWPHLNHCFEVDR